VFKIGCGNKPLGFPCLDTSTREATSRLAIIKTSLIVKQLQHWTVCYLHYLWNSRHKINDQAGKFAGENS
jgi:hypothetical protein